MAALIGVAAIVVLAAIIVTVLALRGPGHATAGGGPGPGHATRAHGPLSAGSAEPLSKLMPGAHGRDCITSKPQYPFAAKIRCQLAKLPGGYVIGYQVTQQVNYNTEVTSFNTANGFDTGTAGIGCPQPKGIAQSQIGWVAPKFRHPEEQTLECFTKDAAGVSTPAMIWTMPTERVIWFASVLPSSHDTMHDLVHWFGSFMTP